MAKRRRREIKFLDALPEDGERRLMLAVLLDAIRILQKQRPRPRRRRAEQRERAWLTSEDHEGPFSFANICEALGLNAAYVRRRILEPDASLEGIRHPLPLSTNRRR
jgi:hypothetical protein